MTSQLVRPTTGAVRRDARQKVTGEARYAVDRTPPGCLHACPVPATVARAGSPPCTPKPF